MCENPPGYEPLEVLKKKYPLIDATYQPIMPWKLPKEGFGDDACVPRVEKTLKGIQKRFPGQGYFSKCSEFAIVIHISV